MRAATRTTAIVAIVIAGAAACGSSSSGGTAKVASQGNAGATGTDASGAVVMTRSGSNGTYLTDGKGMTLYLFKADKTSASTCSSACATYWPPYTTKSAPTASGKAQQSKIGTSKRSDGSTQVTYDGHPLYHFSLDSSAGDTKGQGSNNFGAEWYIVAPNGSSIDKGDGSGSSSGSSSGSRGSYY